MTLFMKAFPRLRMQISSWMSVGKKYTKFSKNEKNEFLNTLYFTFYDGTNRVRGYIDKILGFSSSSYANFKESHETPYS